MDNTANLLPYVFEVTEFNSHFNFKKSNIIITGVLPHKKRYFSFLYCSL